VQGEVKKLHSGGWTAFLDEAAIGTSTRVGGQDSFKQTSKQKQSTQRKAEMVLRAKQPTANGKWRDIQVSKAKGQWIEGFISGSEVTGVSV